eukprot:167673_1
MGAAACAACSQYVPCAKNAVESAGSEIGSSLLKKGKSMSGQAGSRILDRVESTFDDKVDKIISEKLLEKCDTTFNTAIDSFVDSAFSTAMKQFGPKDQGNDAQDLNEEAKVMKQRKEERIVRAKKARERLRDYGLSQLLIDRMETEGWLDERNWEILTKDQLQAMGFCDGHIELFMGGINKNKRAKTIASDKLKRWSIPQSLINTMHEDGYLDEAKWEYLRNEALYAENLERRVKEEARRQKEEDKREYDEKYGDQGHKWNLGFKSKAREIDIHRSLSTNYVQSKANDEYPYFNTTLHRIGFEYVHIESFLDGMEKQEEANRPAESI